MNIKERINTIKAKRTQIEALLSAKEKEVEEEYQMVMELYNEAKIYSERVEAIKAKQKTTEETLDKYDSLIAFLNDDLPVVEETKEEPVVEETKEEPVVEETKEEPANSSENIDELLNLIDLPKEEKKEETENQFAQDFDKPSKKEETRKELIKYSTPIKPTIKNEMIAESDDMDEFISLAPAPKEEEETSKEKKEVKLDSKWKVSVEKTTEEETANKENVDSLLDQIGAL